jgi:hypothetical protein
MFVIFSWYETEADVAYVIEPEPMFWNNEDGWGSLAEATVFTKTEREAYQHRVPAGGTWVALPQIQVAWLFGEQE